MRAASSVDRPFAVPVSARTAMVAIGLVPFLHAATTAALIAMWLTDMGPRYLAVVALVVLYLLPPAATRLATVRPLPTGEIEIGTTAFLRWWFTAQWQMVFARLPMLEEILRLVPGLYSAWLRLWGARVGSLVYWSPGVTVLDRGLIDVGNRVVVGAGVLVAPHAIAPPPGKDTGRVALFLGRVRIGSDAIIGGYAKLLPGCEIGSGETTPPFRTMHYFRRFEGGRRGRV